MPHKLRRLSGDDVIKVFERLGFSIHSQRGSHVKLRRVTKDGLKQTLTIPRHRELDRGTLLAIFRQACRYEDRSRLKAYFYSE